MIAEARGGLRGLARHDAQCRPAAAGRDHGPPRPASTACRRTSTRAASRSGLPSVKRDNPDIYALEVMNEILGGSGFTARITKTVRSNEGLAYSAGSGISFGVWQPGTFRAAFQSKSRTVAYAAELVLQEIRRMRETLVTDEELTTIKNNLIADLPEPVRLEGAGDGDLRARTSTRAATPPSGRPIATASRPSPPPTSSAWRRPTSCPRRWCCWWSAIRRRSTIGDDKHPVKLTALAPGGKVDDAAAARPDDDETLVLGTRVPATAFPGLFEPTAPHGDSFLFESRGPAPEPVRTWTSERVEHSRHQLVPGRVRQRAGTNPSGRTSSRNHSRTHSPASAWPRSFQWMSPGT